MNQAHPETIYMRLSRAGEDGKVQIKNAAKLQQSALFLQEINREQQIQTQRLGAAQRQRSLTIYTTDIRHLNANNLCALTMKINSFL